MRVVSRGIDFLEFERKVYLWEKQLVVKRLENFIVEKKLSGAENGVELKIHGMTKFTGLESGKC